MIQRIPKTIHFCWFGNQPIPDEQKSFIDDWLVKNPDYKIIKWNEENSPLEIEYLDNALKMKNWANMSNFVRFYALSKYGGIYLDTDVFCVKNFDPLLTEGCFLGFEEGKYSSDELWVNNAIMGASKGHSFIELCLNSIQEQFDGSESANLSAPRLVTQCLKTHYGLTSYGDQLLDDIRLFPIEYFYPIHHSEIYKLKQYQQHITHVTYAIHMWDRSWLSREQILNMYDDLQHESNSIKKEFEHQISNFEKQIIDLENQNSNLSKQLTSSNQKYDHTVSELFNIRTEKDSIKQKNDHLKKYITEYIETQNSKLSKELASLNANFDGIKNELATSQNEKELLIWENQQNLEEFNSQLNLLQVHFENLISDLNNQNSILLQKNKAQLLQLEKSKSAFSEIQTHYQLQKQSYKNLEEKLSLSEKQSTLQRTELKDKNHIIHNLTNFISKQNEEAKKKENELIKLFREKEHLFSLHANALKTKEELIQSQQNKIDNLNSETFKLQQTLKVNKEYIASLQNQITNLEHLIKSKNLDLETILSFQKENNTELLKLLNNKVDTQRKILSQYKQCYENKSLLSILAIRFFKKKVEG